VSVDLPAGQAPKKARRAAASAARSAAPAAAAPRAPPVLQPPPPPGSCSRAAPWPALALPHHAKPPPMLLSRAGRISAESCRQRLGGNRRQPFTFLPDGDGAAHSSGGSSSGNGAGVAKAARSLSLPNLHTAAHESRARLYRLCLRRSRIAQLGVYTIGACPVIGARRREGCRRFLLCDLAARLLALAAALPWRGGTQVIPSWPHAERSHGVHARRGQSTYPRASW